MGDSIEMEKDKMYIVAYTGIELVTSMVLALGSNQLS